MIEIIGDRGKNTIRINGDNPGCQEYFSDALEIIIGGSKIIARYTDTWSIRIERFSPYIKVTETIKDLEYSSKTFRLQIETNSTARILVSDIPAEPNESRRNFYPLPTEEETNLLKEIDYKALQIYEDNIKCFENTGDEAKLNIALDSLNRSHEACLKWISGTHRVPAHRGRLVSFPMGSGHIIGATPEELLIETADGTLKLPPEKINFFVTN